MDHQFSLREPLVQSGQLAGKRLLIVGAGGGPLGERMAQPVRRARELGVEIVLLDTLESCVAAFADTVIEVDLADYAACRDAVQRFVASTPLDGIVTFAEEQTETTSRLQRDFGFPGHSVFGCRAVKDKQVTRQILEANGVPVPNFARVESRSSAAEVAEWFSFPAFLKTVGGGGAVATRRVENRHDVVSAFDDALHEINNAVPEEFRETILGTFTSERAKFLIEEYLEPSKSLQDDGLGRVTIELLVQNGHIRFFAVADGLCRSGTDHRYSTICFPSRLSVQDQHRFRELAEEVVSIFDLANGPVVLDAVLTDEGPQLYEINAWIEDAHVLPLIKACWNIDLVEETLKIAAGIPVSICPKQAAQGAALIHFMLAPERSRVVRLDLPERSVSEPDCKVLTRKSEGDIVAGPEGAYDAITVIEIKGENPDCVDRKLRGFLIATALATETEPLPVI